MTNRQGAARLLLAARLKPSIYAFAGISFMLRTQHNARVHLATTVIVVGLGVGLRVSLLAPG